MRQIRRMIGDRIDVEEDRARDMAFEIFRLGVAFFGGKQKGAVDHREIGRVEIFGKPRGRDEERIRAGLLSCPCLAFRGAPHGALCDSVVSRNINAIMSVFFPIKTAFAQA